MIFSRQWLSEYIDGDVPSAEDISRELGLHSFEVEGITDLRGDHLIDIDILPNRAHDAMSYLGMAREIALVFDLKFKIVDIDVATSDFSSRDMISVSVQDPLLTPRVTKRVIKNIKIGPSPQWLQDKLESMGQRPINNVVDITNFVMYEFGQPVHAFDYDKLANNEGLVDISVRKSKEGESIDLLDGSIYELNPEIVVISDSEKALDIAGVKGGNHSGIDESTTTVVLSVCNFDASNIRKASRDLGLRTDASSRFEKGLSPQMVLDASNRAAQLICDIAGGEVSRDLVDIYPSPQTSPKISLHRDKVHKLLGVDISIEKIQDILTRLRFEYLDTGEGVFEVTPPLDRLDIQIQEDIAEEIARVFGYANIPEADPKNKSEVSIQKEFYWIHKIKDVLVSAGLYEVSTYSFVGQGSIELRNALADDKRFLRESLVFGLRDAIDKASKYKPLLGLGDVGIFEIGKVFCADSEAWELASSVDVADIIEGCCGIKPDYIEDYRIDLGLYIAQLPDPDSYDDLKSLSLESGSFETLSPYPFVLRDVAVWVPDTISVEEVQEVIETSAGDMLVRSDLFDEYSKEGRTSYAFKLVFQSNKKTLTDKEVNSVTDSIYKALEDRGWEIR